MRFIIEYRVGDNLREDVIEAKDLDEAEKKANEKRPKWESVKYKDNSNAKEN